jgi:TRAP-type mannitol/chloroaromatic compound transport system substrate-binding protein
VPLQSWKKGDKLPDDFIKSLKIIHDRPCPEIQSVKDAPKIESKDEEKKPSTRDGITKISDLKITPASYSRRGFIFGLGVAAGSAVTYYTQSGSLYHPPMSTDLPTIQWKMIDVVSSAYGFPEESYLVNIAYALKDKIEKFTAGKFIINIVDTFTPQLKPLSMFDDANNTYDCAYSSIYLQNREQNSNKYKSLYFRYAIPFGLSPEGQMAWLFEKDQNEILSARQKLFNDKLKYPFISFPLATTGFQSGLWSNKELKTTDDFIGLKVRISGIGAEVFKALGATVNPDEIDEAYKYAGMIRIDNLKELLNKGVLDAAEWLSFEDDIDLLELNDVARYLYAPAWWEPSTSFDLHIRQTSWDQLAPIYQRLVELVCMELYLASWTHYLVTNANNLPH